MKSIVTSRGGDFFWLGLRDRRTDWRGVAGKGRGVASLWLLFAFGRNLPVELEDSGPGCYASRWATRPPHPPLAEPVLGRCHPRGYRSGAVYPSLPLTRRGALLPAPGLLAERQACASRSRAFLGARRPVQPLRGSPAARPGGAWAHRSPRPYLDSRSGTGASWSTSCQCLTLFPLPGPDGG